jgi:hypothetical protein
MRIRIIKLFMVVVAMAGALSSGSASAVEQAYSSAGCTPFLLDGQNIRQGSSFPGQHLAGAVYEPTRGWSNMNPEYGMFVYCPIPSAIGMFQLRGHLIQIDTFQPNSSGVTTVRLASVSTSGVTKSYGTELQANRVGFNTFSIDTTSLIPDANLGDYFFLKILVPRYTSGGTEPSSLRGIRFIPLF